jgi:hypothetical protein
VRRGVTQRKRLADLQALAAEAVTFANGSSLSLSGQTWSQLALDDVLFVV